MQENLPEYFMPKMQPSLLKCIPKVKKQLQMEVIDVSQPHNRFVDGVKKIEGRKDILELITLQNVNGMWSGEDLL